MHYFEAARRVLLNNRRLQRNVFALYSFLKNWESLVLFLTPNAIVHLYLKLVLRKIGDGTFIDSGFYFRYGKKISIGNNVEINRNCSFYPSFLTSNGKISIGDNSIIAPSVSIFAVGQGRYAHEEHVSGDVIIGQNVYIGANSIIRYGVSIGDNSTVAIGSVVVKSVPANVTVGGNPACIIS